jgi:energy-coupling factor transporter ATP-binding protein EcfA2
MLAVVFGASGSGKSTQAGLLRRLLPEVAVHDFDDVGGSPPWDNAWRRRGTSRWIERARGHERDVLVLGGVPGEVLALPGAVELDGLAFCLLDCSDVERVRRLVERERDDLISPHQLWDHVAWGVWLRFHAVDPRWWAGPLRGGDDDGLSWSRWETWRRGDRRWRIERVDTTGRPAAETAEALSAWFRARQSERDAGTLPLSGRWWDG